MREARPVEHRFAGRETLAAALADRLVTLVEADRTRRAGASLVLSGGSTPAPLLAALARAPLVWRGITLTLADERWVDPADPASNEGALRRGLLDAGASAARLVPLKNPAPTPEAGEAATAAALAGVPRPFSAVVLGMGEDGHTASLFPGAPELARGLDTAASDTCIAVNPPGVEHPRLSLTLAALLDTACVFLHITGAAKWAVYERALEGGAAEAMPIRAVLAQTRTPVEIYWAP